MAFWGDYHTHTTYSHGKGSVSDNAVVASSKGLKQLAVTDHGMRHVIFGVRKRFVDDLIADCEKATESTGVLVLAGIENNLASYDGDFDIRPEYLDKLDIVQGGYHKATIAWTLGQQFSFQFKNLFYSGLTKSPKKLMVRTTEANRKLIDNYELDFVGHLNRDFRADALTVARYAKQKGTYIELNGKKFDITDKELEKMAEEGIEFVCNSDAHTPERVGDMGVGFAAAERLHVPHSLIANWDRIPDFRSHNFKRAVKKFEDKKQKENFERDGQN